MTDTPEQAADRERIEVDHTGPMIVGPPEDVECDATDNSATWALDVYRRSTDAHVYGVTFSAPPNADPAELAADACRAAATMHGGDATDYISTWPLCMPDFDDMLDDVDDQPHAARARSKSAALAKRSASIVGIVASIAFIAVLGLNFIFSALSFAHETGYIIFGAMLAIAGGAILIDRK